MLREQANVLDSIAGTCVRKAIAIQQALRYTDNLEQDPNGVINVHQPLESALDNVIRQINYLENTLNVIAEIIGVTDTAEKVKFNPNEISYRG